MIPERSSLPGYLELVKEGMAWCDGTLGNTSGSVGPSAASLEKSVPMLERKGKRYLCSSIGLTSKLILTILVLRSMSVSVRASMTFNENVPPFSPILGQ